MSCLVMFAREMGYALNVELNIRSKADLADIHEPMITTQVTVNVMNGEDNVNIFTPSRKVIPMVGVREMAEPTIANLRKQLTSILEEWIEQLGGEEYRIGSEYLYSFDLQPTSLDALSDIALASLIGVD